MMKRNIHGIFLLDKPLGGSSNHALQKVKRLFNAVKAGHTGSLDPLATGMLPICLGEATKYSQHLLDADKCYEVTAMLGVRTDTGDSEGQIIAQFGIPVSVAQVSLLGHPSPRGTPALRSESSATLSTSSQDLIFKKEQLLETFKKFTGEIQQIPPMHSALKHKGRPLYEYARKGETIERPARTVNIYNFELLNDVQIQDLPLQTQTISLRVHCSKGTYIRSLIDDIGEELGCGAHVIALRRLWVEPFQSAPMITLEQLENTVDKDALLLPLDAALTAWPKQILNGQQAKRLLQGLPVFIINASTGFARFYDKTQTFLGVGNIATDGEITNKRLIQLSI